MARRIRLAAAASILLILQSLATLDVAAQPQQGDELQRVTLAVIDQLQGIREELRGISERLAVAERYQQVGVLMSRIRLKQERVNSIETDLRSARAKEEKASKQLAELQEMERGVADTDPASVEGGREGLQRHLDFVAWQKNLAEQEMESSRLRAMELENDLQRVRDAMSAMEDTIDELLDLR